MPNVITFTPRPVAPPPMPPNADPDLRAHLEEAAAAALDAADKIIAALDQIEDGPGAKPVEPDPSFKAMAAHAGQVMTLREPVAPPETPAEPEIAPEPQEAEAPPSIVVPEPLRWYGAGNVVAAAGIALLWLVPRG